MFYHILYDKRQDLFEKLRNDKNNFFHEDYLDKDCFELILSLLIFKECIFCKNDSFLTNRCNQCIQIVNQEPGEFYHIMRRENNFSNKLFFIKFDLKFPNFTFLEEIKTDYNYSINRVVMENPNYSGNIILKYKNNIDSQLISNIIPLKFLNYYKREIKNSDCIGPSRDILSHVEFDEYVEYVDITINGNTHRFYICGKKFELFVIMDYCHSNFYIKPNIKTKMTGYFIFPGIRALDFGDMLWNKFREEIIRSKNSITMYRIPNSYHKVLRDDGYEKDFILIPNNETLYWCYEHNMIYIK